MDLNDKQHLYKILRSRDKRYDGRFYTGVKTTGIYCRPICPAQPKIENVIFYRSSAEAENAGLRPCLRCRPDLAPESVRWDGTAATVGRALALISRGEFSDSSSIAELSLKLGVSDRHLRRLFEDHVGASPLEVIASKRLHLAKQLLTQSNLPVTEIAFASGYKSIRRMNEEFKAKFKVAPSTMRKSKKDSAVGDFISIDLPVIAPFDWDHIYNFLKNHCMIGVEECVDNKYRRAFAIEDTTGSFEVTYDSKSEQLKARIAISNPIHLRVVIEKIRDLFDARLNPHAHLDDLIGKDPISVHYKKNLGIRVPGAWDSFETAICIILGQLVSVEQARFKVQKLVSQFGTPVKNPIFPNCNYLFPTPLVLSKAVLKDIGMTKVREQAIHELSLHVWEQKIQLSRASDIQKTRELLLDLNGIGPWTVEMIAMRCLGDANAFPKSDLIIQRALELHKNKKGDWNPWNAYIALSLWKKYAVLLSKTKNQKIKKPTGIKK